MRLPGSARNPGLAPPSYHASSGPLSRSFLTSEHVRDHSRFPSPVNR